MRDSNTRLRPIDRLLSDYGASHRNRVNKAIHWIAVPVIFWCVLALLTQIPFPGGTAIPSWANWALVAAGLGTIYYVVLSPPLAIGMALWCAACLWAIAHWPERVLALWSGALAMFVIAWVAQLVGHAIEGKRPSFFKDVQFLLIGPAWLMHIIFNRAGIRY
jgi:uncharacterized membrane protein YGL010W